MQASAPAHRPAPTPHQRGSLDGLIHTFSSSGSHESRVKDRTLEQCTPRLLDREEAGVRQGVAPPQPPPVPRPQQAHLWMPEHSMQSSTPRLMLAQRGSGWPQSPHWPLPATFCTRCSRLSPLTPRSRESVAESMLLVEGDAVRSSLWGCVRGRSALRSSGLPPQPQPEVPAQGRTAEASAYVPWACAHPHSRCTRRPYTEPRSHPTCGGRLPAARPRAHTRGGRSGAPTSL